MYWRNKEDGYTEEYSHFNPLNVYGQSKPKGELNVLKSNQTLTYLELHGCLVLMLPIYR
jgi:dTDP-4-dehydrorhamnose reductase